MRAARCQPFRLINDTGTSLLGGFQSREINVFPRPLKRLVGSRKHGTSPSFQGAFLCKIGARMRLKTESTISAGHTALNIKLARIHGVENFMTFPGVASATASSARLCPAQRSVGHCRSSCTLKAVIDVHEGRDATGYGRHKLGDSSFTRNGSYKLIMILGFGF